MARTRFLSIVAATLVAAGCTGGGAGSPSAAPVTAAPATSAPATAAPATAAPATQAATVPSLCAASEAAGGGPVAAGAYAFDASTPPFTLTLPDGYSVACSLSTLVLFGPEGSIVIVTGVAFVNEGGSPTKVDPTVAAVQAAVVAAAKTATEPTAGKIGTLDAVEMVVTPTDKGFVVKGIDERGWGFGTDEAPNAAISIAEVKAGTVVLVLRHGIGSTAPSAVGLDILASLAWQ